MAFMTPDEIAVAMDTANSDFQDTGESLGNVGQAASSKAMYEGIVESENSPAFEAAGNFGNQVLASTAVPVADLGLNIAGMADGVWGNGEMRDEIAQRQGERDLKMFGMSGYNEGMVDPKAQHNIARDLAGFVAANKAIDLTAKAIGGIAGMTYKTVADGMQKSGINKAMTASKAEASPLFKAKIAANTELKAAEQELARAESALANSTTTGLGANPQLEAQVKLAEIGLKKAKKTQSKISKAREDNIQDTVKLDTQLKGVGAETFDDSAAAMLAKDSKDMSLGGNLAEQGANTLGHALKADVAGTIPMVDTYTSGKDGIKTKEVGEQASEFGNMMAINALFSGAVAGIGTGLKVKKGMEARNLIDERATGALDAKKQNINLTEQTLSEFGDLTTRDLKNGKKVKANANLSKMNEKGIYGVFQTTDGNVVLSSPKLGTMKLYKDADGQFYTKKKDQNVFTEEGLVSTVRNDGGQSKYIVEPRGKKYDSYNQDALMYNSIKTEQSTVDNQGNVIFTSKTVKKGGQNDRLQADLNKRKQTITDSYGLDNILREVSSDVQIKRSTAQNWVNAALSMDIDASTIKNPTARAAVEAVQKIKADAEAMFEPGVLDSTVNTVIADVARGLDELYVKDASSDTRNIIETLSNKLSTNGRRVTKKELNDIIDYSVKESMVKLLAKIKQEGKTGGKNYISEKDSFSLASSIVNNMFDMAGISKREGGQIDAVKKKLTEKVAENFDTEMLTGDRSTTLVESQTKIKGVKEDVLTTGHTFMKATSDGNGIKAALLQYINGEDLATLSETARDILRNDIYRLGGLTNVTKQSADYTGTTLKPQRGGSALDASKLDPNSLPISSLETTGSLYQAMGESVYRYRMTPKEVMAKLDELDKMTDSQLARYMEYKDNIDPSKSLDENFVLKEDVIEAQDAVRGLRQEISEHRYSMQKYNPKKGITFDIMKVPTNRLQFTGYLNPQQGLLSKMMLGLSANKLDAAGRERFYGTGVRTALDEHPELLQLIDAQRLKDEFGIEDVDTFDIKKWDAEDTTAVRLATEINDAMNDGGIVDRTTMDADRASNTIRAIAEDKPSEVIGEIDGVTNMKGMTDAMLKLERADTGINLPLKDAGKDMYEVFMDEVESAFKGFGFKRKDVKTPVFGGLYGMDAINVSTQLIHEYITKSIDNLKLENTKPAEFDAAVKSLRKITRELDAKLALKDADKHMARIVEKIQKSDLAMDILARYNIKAEEVANGKGKIDNVLFNSIDQLEQTGMKVDKTVQDLFTEFKMYYAADFSSKITKGLNSLEAGKGMESIRNMTKVDIEAVSNYLGKDRAGAVEKALNKAMGKEAIELKNNVTKIFERGYINTMVALGNRANSSFRNALMDDLGIKGKDRAALKTTYNSRGHVSIMEFAEDLHRMGYDTLQSTTMSSIIPGFRNAFGDKINYVNMKGVGYDKATQTVYQTFSPIDNPFPFLLHSTDSSLMGIGSRVSRDGINMRWDAVLDHNSDAIAHELNRGTGYLFARSNIGTRLTEAYGEQRAVLNMTDNAAKEAIYRDMGRKRLALRDADMSEMAIDAEATKIRESMADDLQLHQDITGIEKTLKDRNKEIEGQGDLTMEQYSDGKLSTKVTKQHLDDMELTGVSTILSPHQTLELRNLKNIHNDGKAPNPLHKFSMHSIDSQEFVADVQKMGKGKQSAYEPAVQRISVDVDSSHPTFLPKFVHEAIHSITVHVMGENYTLAVAQEFNTLKKQMHDKGLTILRNGKKITNKLAKEDIDLEGKGISKMDKDVIYGNELAANMLDDLIANEVIYSNAELVAKMTKRKNLDKDMKPLEIYNEVTDTTYSFLTIGEFTDFLTANELHGHIDTINNITTRVGGLMNGSSKFRDMYFNKKLNAFESTIKDVHKKTNLGRKEIIKMHQKLDAIPFFEIAEVNPTKEALLTAVGMKNGATGIIEQVVAQAIDTVLGNLEKTFGGDYYKYSKVMGDSVNMGLNKLMFSNIESRFEYLNISKDKLFDNSGGMKSLSELQETMRVAVDTLYKDLAKDNDIPRVKQEYNSIMNDVRDLAQGGTRTNLRAVARRMEEFAKPRMSKVEFSSFNSKLMIQKLASMYRIAKNEKAFKGIHDLVGKEYAGFQAYMEAMNVHENPYSLFGENVEFQFLENGKEGRIVDESQMANIKPEDIIGTIRDEDGRKLSIVSVEASERLIATQESNMMTINVSDFEQGIYNKGGVHLNAQNINQGTHNVDSGIHKQIARNIYLKTKDEMSKDLGYRQWHMLRENGIYNTKAEMEKLKSINPNREFVQLSQENPHAKVMGNDFWIDKKYAHIINGTDGIDLAKFGKAVAGDTEFAKTVTQMSKVIYDGTKVLRNLILVARPSSYINSFVSSMGLYWIMKDPKSGGSAIGDVRAAKKSIDGYRKLMQTYAKHYTNDKAKAAKAWKNVTKHELHAAMEGGLVNTIRADAYKIGSIPEMTMYTAIKKATGSHQYGNAMKTLGLDPSTPMGAQLGTFFDYTELMPKVALYLNLKRTHGDAHAVQKTTMAFPTYQNLPHFLNMIDQVSPYTKFFASTPRMIMYGLNQSPMKMGATAVMANTLPAASFMFASEEDQKKWKFYKENDFIKLPFIPVAYSSTSLFPTVTNPFVTPFSDGPFDVGFFASGAKSMTNSSTYFPGTYMGD